MNAPKEKDDTLHTYTFVNMSTVFDPSFCVSLVIFVDFLFLI